MTLHSTVPVASAVRRGGNVLYRGSSVLNARRAATALLGRHERLGAPVRIPLGYLFPVLEVGND